MAGRLPEPGRVGDPVRVPGTPRQQKECLDQRCPSSIGVRDLHQGCDEQRDWTRTHHQRSELYEEVGRR